MSDRTVFKYELDPMQQRYTLKGSNPHLLHAEGIGFRAFMWVEHDLVGRADVEMVLVPTGGDVPEGMSYWRTILLNGGSYVFHIYWHGEDA